jgi:hypothetical protein
MSGEETKTHQITERERERERTWLDNFKIGKTSI